MPSLIEPGEMKNGSTFQRQGVKGVVCPMLEKVTGADMALAPDGRWQAGIMTDEKAAQLAGSGAAFMQLKRGHDIFSSIEDGRIVEAQIRMKAAGIPGCQRWLVSFGNYTKHGDQVWVDGTPAASSGMSWWRFIEAVEGWSDSGGQYRNIPDSECMAEWVVRRQKKVDAYATEPVSLFFPRPEKFLVEGRPDVDDGLRAVIYAPPGAQLLAQLPGLGPVRAMTMLEQCGGVAGALSFISDQDTHKKDAWRPDGIGPETLRKARSALELKDGERLQIIT